LQLELNQFDWINWIGKSYKKEIKDGFEFPNRLNQFEEFFLKKKKVILEPALEKLLGEVLTNRI